MTAQIENWRVRRATQWEDVPAPVQHHTKLVLLDTLGVILAGAERPEVRQLRERLAAGAGSGRHGLCARLADTDPRTAALLNGIAGRSIELCEGLRFVSGQAAMQVLPGVLAVGEHARQLRPRNADGACSSATMSPRGLPAGSRRGRWRIRTARCRCWRRPPRERACAVSTRPASAAPCASRRRSC